MAYSPLNCQLLSPRTVICCLNGLYNYTLGRPILSLSQLPGEYSALNTGLTAVAQELEPAPSLWLPNAKYPLHLGGVKQWLKEDLLNSSMPWWGLEPGTSVSAV